MIAYKQIKEHYIAVKERYIAVRDDLLLPIGRYIGDKLIYAGFWALEPSRQRLLYIRFFSQLNAIVYLILLSYATAHRGMWIVDGFVRCMAVPFP